MPTTEISIAKTPTCGVKCTTYPQGPYTTGCADIMVGKDKEGSLMRLYYPATNSPWEAKSTSTTTKDWTRWFLGEKYTEGLARIHMPRFQWFYTWMANKMQRDTLTPAIWEAPILADEKFPLVIFSHGLMANRSLYSCICNEIASHGFIVAAIEHRDESACATFTLNSEGEKDWILIRTIAPKENEFKIREEQIGIRAKECSRALDLFEKLNTGQKVSNELSSKFQLESMKNKIDLTNPIVAGQSFGGGTAIVVAAKDKRFKLAISLDPWMFPLKDQAKKLSETLEQPILFILMEEFQDELNLEQLKLFQKSKKNEFHTIKKGLHLQQVDAAILCSNEYVIIQKIIECYSPDFAPEVPMAINNVLMMKFICTNLNIRKDYIKSCDTFLTTYGKHVTRNAQGSASSMLGWDTLVWSRNRFACMLQRKY